MPTVQSDLLNSAQLGEFRPGHAKVEFVPTVKVVADSMLGYMIINAEDFIEGVHVRFDEVSEKPARKSKAAE